MIPKAGTSPNGPQSALRATRYEVEYGGREVVPIAPGQAVQYRAYQCRSASDQSEPKVPDMPVSAVIPATTTYRMTSLAWAWAVQSAAEPLRGEAGEVPGHSPRAASPLLTGLDEPTLAAIAGELATAGITDASGTLHTRWRQALARGAAAPIQVTLVSRSDGRSTHCRVNLFEGRGLAVEFTRPVATAADGSVAAAGVADVVTVTLLSEEALWPVLARSMPPFPELTAGTTGPTNVAAATATVDLEVRTRTTGTGLQYRAAGAWAVSGRLYSVRTTGAADERRTIMAEAASGDIAREVVWHVLGAHDFLARRGSAEVAS